MLETLACLKRFGDVFTNRHCLIDRTFFSSSSPPTSLSTLIITVTIISSHSYRWWCWWWWQGSWSPLPSSSALSSSSPRHRHHCCHHLFTSIVKILSLIFICPIPCKIYIFHVNQFRTYVFHGGCWTPLIFNWKINKWVNPSGGSKGPPHFAFFL